jgi:hypothetical protein
MAGAGNDKEAVAKFREAVDAKKRSKAYMGQNIWFIYKDQEQDNVRHDVREALEYVDEILASEERTLFMLKLPGKASDGN